MKRSKIIFIAIFSNVLAVYANTEQSSDTIDVAKLVDVRIAQSEEKQYVVKLFIHNPQSDSIFLRAMFHIDDPSRLSHILIYHCEYQADVDSVICDWHSLSGEADPSLTFIEHAKGKVFIPAKSTVSFEIPIWGNYVESEIYLKVQLLFVYNDRSYVYKNTTNRIFVERKKKSK